MSKLPANVVSTAREPAHTIGRTPDGRLRFDPVYARATWRERATDALAVLGLLAGAYIITFAMIIFLH